jgi:GT2 family glycosyltransferase
MDPTASVIVPVRNAEKLLAEQLNALANQADAPPFEVIVALNQCDDRSDLVARAFHSRLELTIVEANEKQSAAHARNAGAARASAPYLLFCDADDRVGHCWVREMVRALADTDADFVGGRAFVDRNHLPRWVYDAFYRDIDAEGLNLHYPGLRYPLTASFGVSREAFEAVGGFDESFPGTGHEEIDLTAQLGRAGYRVGVASKAEVLYRPRTSFRSLTRQRRLYAKGGAYSLFKEGTPIAPQSLFDEISVLARTVGRLVLREKQWRPTALAAIALDEWFRYRATQRLPNERLTASTPADLILDFTVDPAAPVVGGLTLLAPASQGYRNAIEGVAPTSLALIPDLVQRGDVVLDVGADIGVVTLSAAFLVGRSGRVVSVEPEPRARGLMLRNAERHDVADRVAVMPAFDADGSTPAAQIGLARIDTRRVGAANGLTRFHPDQWSLWAVDENERSVSPIRAAGDAAPQAVVLATPRRRDSEVDAAIRRLVRVGS